MLFALFMILLLAKLVRNAEFGVTNRGLGWPAGIDGATVAGDLKNKNIFFKIKVHIFCGLLRKYEL